MWKLRTVLALVTHEMAWRFRMWVGARILPKRFADALDQLRTQGAAVIPGYYSADELEVMEGECQTAVRKAEHQDIVKGRIGRMPGSLRLQHLQEDYPLLRRISHDAFIVALNMVFAGRFRWPAVMYGITHDGSYNDPAVPGRAEDVFGGHYHVDHWLHQLKALTPLQDVGPENGPLCFVPGSSGIHWKALENYDASYRVKHAGPKDGGGDGGEQKYNRNGVKQEVFASIAEKRGTQLATAKRGDLILFDTRNLHYATRLEKGCRRVLWMYF